MRGLLVVNHKASATTERTRDVLIHALAAQFHLETVRTDHRGHALELGRRAVQEGMDVVVTFGGDGTVNETVNGMLTGMADIGGRPEELPRFGAVPGGSAMSSRGRWVSTGCSGGDRRPGGCLRNDRTRVIGLTQAAATREDGTDFSRWVTFNAGLGLDAQIIHNMEDLRARGKDATPTRYLTTTLRTFFAGTDRKHPRITLDVPGQGSIPGVFLAIVQNASPWTYLGTLAVNPLPETNWDNGIGVWAIRRMTTIDGLRYSRRIVMGSKAGSTRNGLFVGKDLNRFSARAPLGVQLQIDGEGLGEVTSVTFESFPRMLRVFI
jgi:diacylglycerol kinase family enzyme